MRPAARQAVQHLAQLALAIALFGAALALVTGESGTTDANTGYAAPAYTSRYAAFHWGAPTPDPTPGPMPDPTCEKMTRH